MSTLIILILTLSASKFKDISEICERVSNKFTLYFSKKTIDYNVQSMFERGMFMGKGSFGEVRSSDFNVEGVTKVAIKRIESSKIEITEFDGLVEFSSINVGPTFYGCQYNDKEVFIVQSLLYKDLSYPAVMSRIKSKKNSEFIQLILEIVLSLEKMWANGYLHNDLKEDNIMVDFEQNIVLIDFGLASPLKKCLPSAGSPLYMSPRKWVHGCKRAETRDDMYSIGIMIGLILAQKGYETISQYVMVGNKKYSVTDSCFSENFNSECNYVFKTNIYKILTDSNFGNYHRSNYMRDASRINFTTLVSMMIEFSKFTFEYKTIIEILQRQIKEFKELENGKLDILNTKIPPEKIAKESNDKADTFQQNRKYPLLPESYHATFDIIHKKAMTSESDEKQKKEHFDREIKKKEEELRMRNVSEDNLQAELLEKQNQIKKEENDKRIQANLANQRRQIMNQKAKQKEAQALKLEQENKLKEEQEKALLKAKEDEAKNFLKIDLNNKKKSLIVKGINGKKQSKLIETSKHVDLTYEKKIIQVQPNDVALNQVLVNQGILVNNPSPVAVNNEFKQGYKTVEEGAALLKKYFPNLKYEDGVYFVLESNGKKSMKMPMNISPQDKKIYEQKMLALMRKDIHKSPNVQKNNELLNKDNKILQIDKKPIHPHEEKRQMIVA